MSTALTICCLKLASFVLAILGGLLLAFGAYPPVSEGARLFADIGFWPLDGTQAMTAPEARFFAGVGGGALVGFGVMIWMLAAYGLEREPIFVRNTIVAGVMGWFVTDSLASVTAGAPVNALLNVPIMLAFVFPLVWGCGTQRFKPPPS
jgi:hypothetical protein